MYSLQFYIEILTNLQFGFVSTLLENMLSHCCPHACVSCSILPCEFLIHQQEPDRDAPLWAHLHQQNAEIVNKRTDIVISCIPSLTGMLVLMYVDEMGWWLWTHSDTHTHTFSKILLFLPLMTSGQRFDHCFHVNH